MTAFVLIRVLQTGHRDLSITKTHYRELAYMIMEAKKSHGL